MTLKTTEKEESNSFEGLTQHMQRSMKPFELNYGEIPLPTLQSVCFDPLGLSELSLNKSEYQLEDLTNWKGLAMASYQRHVYQMSLSSEKLSGQQSITVLQLLKPYMIKNIATVEQD